MVGARCGPSLVAAGLRYRHSASVRRRGGGSRGRSPAAPKKVAGRGDGGPHCPACEPVAAVLAPHLMPPGSMKRSIQDEDRFSECSQREDGGAVRGRMKVGEAGRQGGRQVQGGKRGRGTGGRRGCGDIERCALTHTAQQQKTSSRRSRKVSGETEGSYGSSST